MKKCRVLYLLSTMERSGPTNVVFNIIKYLDRSLFEPIVVTLSPEPGNTRRADFVNLSVEVRSFLKGRLYWLLSDLHGLVKFIEDLDPDIIHSHSFRPDVSSSKHLGNYRRISTIHGDLTANYRNTYNRFFADWLATKQVLAISRLEMAVACSLYVKEIYAAQVPGLGCVPNGVDHDEASPLPSQLRIAELRRELGLPREKVVITSVGSICERKDPLTVIQGFLQLDTIHNAVLVFVGDGLLKDKLEKQFATDNIKWVGFTKDVAKYLAASDYFISASHSEGLPNTVLEALSFGVPVCLSDIPPHREILKDSPESGFLFPVGDAAQLSSSVSRLMKKDHITMRHSARKTIEEKYTAARMSQHYEILYKKLLHHE